MQLTRSFTLILTISFLLTACGTNNSNNENDHLKAYTTIYPIQYLIEEIGGDKVDVESIYPNDVDAHHYEPSSKQITTIAQGDFFFYLDDHMETSADKIHSALDSQDLSIVEINAEKPLIVEHDGSPDPHIWLDPENMVAMGEVIKDHLSQEAPEDAEVFEDNFKTVSNDMSQLDQDYHDVLDAAQQKQILVAHPAYAYWEDKYNIEQMKISRLDEDPSQKELAALVKEAKNAHITAVIYEKNHNDQLAEMVQNELKADKYEIHSLETRTDDEVENNLDYLAIMQDNLDVLKEITAQ